MSGISFIISTRYASEILELQLISLEYSKNFDNELKIICDNPSWQTLKLLQDRNLIHGKDYYIVNHGHLDQNLDWGVSKATKDYICLTPDDIIFCKDYDKIMMKAMENSQKRIVTPLYFVGNTAGPMLRNYGYPKWKYFINPNDSRKGTGFDFDRFFNEPKPDGSYARYCGSCPVQIMHKEAYQKIGGLTFCSPHAQGHEIEMMTRSSFYGIEKYIAKDALAFHMGTIGNTDAQNTAMGISRGHFKCSICNHLDLSVGDSEHFGTERGRIALETGFYLCECCKKDGWRIDTEKLKLYRIIK